MDSLGGIAVAIVALFLLGWIAWYLLAAPMSQWLCPVLFVGRRDRKRIALTFDDGPGNDTPLILNILKDSRVKATFFLCGANVEKYPQIAKQIADEGHVIGNHAYSHRKFIGKLPDWIQEDIERATDAIGTYVFNPAPDPIKLPGLFRPPYGLRWFGLAHVLSTLRLSTVMWDVNSEDWKQTAEGITDKVVRESKSGSIILLHDGIPPGERGTRENTVRALPFIIAELSKSYEFVTIPQLIADLHNESRTSNG